MARTQASVAVSKAAHDAMTAAESAMARAFPIVTKKQLEKFIRIRNKSPFSSNLQFQIDAEEAGFDAKALGMPDQTEAGYRWQTPHGLLVEEHGKLRLEKKEGE